VGLNDDEKEALISGICPKCWKENEMKGRELWIDYLHETNNDSNAKSQRPNGAARKD